MTAQSDAEAGATFMLEVDEGGTVRHVVGRTQETLGAAPGTFEGKSLYDMVAQSDVWLTTDAFETVVRSGKPYEDRVGLLNRDGDAIAFRIKLTYEPDQQERHRVALYAMFDEGDEITLAQNPGADVGDDLSGILADVEADLRGGEYDAPTLSIYSLDVDEGAGNDIDAILAAADRMADTVKRAAEGHGTSFRVDRQTVSVLHGTGFDADAASDNAASAAGPEFDVGRAAIDLADTDLDVQEKLDLIESTITATRLADMRLEAGATLAAGEARARIEADMAEKRADQPYSLETAYATSTGVPVLALLTFERALSAIGDRPTKGEVRIAGEMLAARLQAAVEVTKAQSVPACVAMDARLLARLGRTAIDVLHPEVLVLATGVGTLTAEDGQRFAAVFAQAKRTIVDGTDLATSSALQRLVAKTGSLEFIRVPAARFGDDPAAVADSFRQIAKLCATRAVGLYVNGVEDPGTALALKPVRDICLGGPAIFPGLFED